MKTIAPPGFPLPTTSRKRKKSTTKPWKPWLRIYGPVQVLVKRNNRSYCKDVWFSLGLGLANVLIGAVNMAAFMYGVDSGDAHTYICTIAYHFFSAEAIISLNHASGWSTPMNRQHRKFVHVLLQICAMATAVAGTTLICVSKGVSGSPHGITGIVTAVFAGFSILSGPCALLNHKYLRLIHMVLSIPTFTMASTSIILGFLTNSFQTWASMAVVIVVIGFIIFYTIFMIIYIFIKCIPQK